MICWSRYPSKIWGWQHSSRHYNHYYNSKLNYDEPSSNISQQHSNYLSETSQEDTNGIWFPKKLSLVQREQQKYLIDKQSKLITYIKYYIFSYSKQALI